MKNKLNVLVLLAIIQSLCSCKDKTTEDFLTVETAPLVFSIDEGTRNIAYSSNVEIKVVSSQPAWCKAAVMKNRSAIEIHVLKNYTVSTEERKATVTVTAGKAEPVQIEVSQGSPSLVFKILADDDEELLFNWQSAQRLFEIETNVSYTAVSSQPAWCTVRQNNNGLIFSVTENDDRFNERTAEVIISVPGLDDMRIKICQLAVYQFNTCDCDFFALPSVISDNMVLQRGQPINFCGKAEKGQTVSISFNGQTVTTQAGTNGVWRLQLEAMPHGGPYEMTIRRGYTVTLKNILVGDVWVCSGQSNMQWTVLNSNNAQTEINNANYPEIRLLTIDRKGEKEPQMKAGTQGWVVCSPRTIETFSAVGYFFGRELYRDLGIPIGLINSSFSGTMIEPWTSISMMRTLPEYAQKLDMLESANLSSLNISSHPTLLFNSMIAPLTLFPIKGAIWYQGESNVGEAYKYRILFPNLITDWRNAWSQGNFPFYFVQLPNYISSPTQPLWAEFRESQHLALQLPNTGEAVTIDVGVANDLHPRNKQDVGYRLSLIALAQTYGRNIVYSGPLYQSMRIEGNKIILTFTHTGSGMIAKGNNGVLSSFTISGSNRVFVPATANIEGNTVVVYSNAVINPVAVRYAWSNNPESANLFNQEGLPTSPFRTDDWQLTTQN